MTAAIVRADARSLPLRDYRDGDGSLTGQIGAEASPRKYVAALLECTREWMRVLKPCGSLWVNLGDKYSDRTGGKHRSGDGAVGRGPQAGILKQTRGPLEKSLLGLPWRYALGCIDDLGLILRAEIIWSKPNGLPESVTDRVRRSHEHWFHFTKEPRYYSALDEIREPHTWNRVINDSWRPARRARQDASSTTPRGGEFASTHPLGKLPGSVWEFATQPLKVPTHRLVWDGHTERWFMSWEEAFDYGRLRAKDHDAWARHRGRPSLRRNNTQHFAAFPPNLIKRIILGWSPTGGVVLDPLCGTGTTVLTADALGRNGIGVDLSFDYCQLARWRTSDRNERARVLKLPKAPKPPRPSERQEILFGGVA